MSPLTPSTTRTPTGGLPAAGSRPLGAFPTLSTLSGTAHCALWCWMRERCTKRSHSSHILIVSEFSDIIIWCTNFSNFKTSGIFLDPVWILSKSDWIRPEALPAMIMFLQFYLSFKFSCQKIHEEGFLYWRSLLVNLLCEPSLKEGQAELKTGFLILKTFTLVLRWTTIFCINKLISYSPHLFYSRVLSGCTKDENLLLNFLTRKLNVLQAFLQSWISKQYLHTIAILMIKSRLYLRFSEPYMEVLSWKNWVMAEDECHQIFLHISHLHSIFPNQHLLEDECHLP